MIGAVGFLTVLGRPAPPCPSAVVWFPVVGTGIGAVVGLVWWAAAEWWPLAVAAALAVAADLVVTGLLHVDGLADAADGLLPPLEAERRLDVMAAPDTGAFGVAAVAMVLVLRYAALASTPVDVALVAAVWCTSRSAMAVALTTVPYARPGGLAASFRGASPWPPAALGVVTVAALALADPARIAVAGLAAAVAFAAVLLLAVRRIGGFTGDVLGAAGVVGETVGLLVAAGRW